MIPNDNIKLPSFGSILALLLALVVGSFLFQHFTNSKPVQQNKFPIQVNSVSNTTSTASQSIKITIRRPSPANPPKPTQHSWQQGASVHMPLVSAPDEGQNASTGLTAGEEEIVIEMGQFSASSGKSEASSSVIASSCLQNGDNSIGVIAGTMPGTIALDLRLAHLGPIGIDLAANHRSVSAGISAGGKIFGLAGGFQGLDGERGIFAGVGVRF